MTNLEASNKKNKQLSERNKLFNYRVGETICIGRKIKGSRRSITPTGAIELRVPYP